MDAVIALMVVGFVVVIGLAVAQWSRRKDRLAAIAASLGGQAVSNVATGARDGVPVHYEFATRGSGSSRENWTYVECPLPPGLPLTLHLCAHGWFDRGKIERGVMVDVEVGDAPFDERFRIEGAPADVVRRILTAPVREFLMSQHRVDVSTDQGRLRLAIRGWIDELPQAEAAIAVAAAMVRDTRGAHAALDAEVPRPVIGGAYRGFPDESPVRAAQAARVDEVAHVEQLRARRQAAARFLAILAFVGFAIIGLAMVLSM